MVNAGMAVGRGRTLEEDVLRTSLSFINRLVEDIILLPLSQYLLIRLGEV
jgi:Ribonuclease G/E